MTQRTAELEAARIAAILATGAKTDQSQVDPNNSASTTVNGQTYYWNRDDYYRAGGDNMARLSSPYTSTSDLYDTIGQVTGTDQGANSAAALQASSRTQTPGYGGQGWAQEFANLTGQTQNGYTGNVTYDNTTFNNGGYQPTGYDGNSYGGIQPMRQMQGGQAFLGGSGTPAGGGSWADPGFRFEGSGQSLMNQDPQGNWQASDTLARYYDRIGQPGGQGPSPAQSLSSAATRRLPQPTWGAPGQQAPQINLPTAVTKPQATQPTWGAPGQGMDPGYSVGTGNTTQSAWTPSADPNRDAELKLNKAYIGRAAQRRLPSGDTR